MYTFDSIVHDLKELGVKEGDTFLLRVSYKAIGKIEGGPKTFLDALLSVVGPQGTIIMTAFPQKYITQLRFLHRNRVSSAENIATPTTGIIPKIAMTYPEAMVSNKLEFPFVVIGQYAEYLTSRHTHDKPAYWLLREAMDKFSCKCLRIGGEPLFGSTHMSLSDLFEKNNYYMLKLRYGLYLRENNKVKWYDESNIVFCHNAFRKFASRITKSSMISEGKVGSGYAIITSMRKSYEEEVRIYSNNIYNLLCDDPNCLLCRTAYSFSDSSKGSFLIRQLKRLFSKDFKHALNSVFDVILNILFAKKS